MERLQEIKQKSHNVVLELMPNVPREELLDDVDLFSLGLDSINAMMLILKFQDTFSVAFEANDISFENFRTIKDIVALIERKKEAAIASWQEPAYAA